MRDFAACTGSVCRMQFAKEDTMNYEKLSPAKFKDNLASGKYQDNTSARRAIGKASSWSDSDKDKARALADAHFGSETPKAAAAKPAVSKAAKKAAKKAATKVAAPKAETPAPKAAKKAAAKKAQSEDDEVVNGKILGTSVYNPTGIQESIHAANSIVTIANSAVTVADQLSKASAGMSLQPIYDEVKTALLQSMRMLNKHGGDNPPSVLENPGPARVSIPTPAAPEETVNGTKELTSEEKAERLLAARPASTISALPRPVS